MKILNKQQVEEAARIEAKRLYGNNCQAKTERDNAEEDFKAGAEYAENELSELAIEFGEKLMIINNNIIKKQTDLKPLDKDSGPILVKDLFKQFIKERYEKS